MMGLELINESSKVRYHFIGDPHMGKKFNNVPLNRKGEREQIQLDKFIDELNTKADITIMVGDLFDVHSVSNNCLMEVYEAIVSAAMTQENKDFILMYGNHDISRDNNIVHSFDILRDLLVRFDNVYVYEQVGLHRYKDEVILVCPYQPFVTSIEAVQPFTSYKIDVAVGHWDTISFNEGHNLLPLEQLLKMEPQYIVTGHEHTAGVFSAKIVNGSLQLEPSSDINETLIHKTGSMQPYSHGEDQAETMYVTRTIDQLQAELATNPNVYKDKCLRVIVKEGEEPPTDIVDCLQYTVKKLKKEDMNMDINLDEHFSFKKIFSETFTSHGVTEETTKEYWNKYQKEASDAQIS